jgi:hypothetical protein
VVLFKKIHVQGVIRNKCTGRNNFHTNHFKNFIILGLFKPSPIVPADSKGFFAAVHLALNSSSGLAFGNIFLDNPIPSALDAFLGQRDACQL